MSRYSTSKDGKEFVWGYDHACGYFVQVWDEDGDFPILDESEINLFAAPSTHKWPLRIFEVAKTYEVSLDNEKVLSEGNPQLHQEWLASPNGKIIQEMAEKING